MTGANLTTIHQGDDYSAVLAIQNPDGTMADLTKYTMLAQLRTDTADRQPVVAATFGITPDPVNAGLATISLPKAVTLTLSGQYLWEFQMTDASNRTATVFGGIVPVIPDVTR